jgi:hypothetical protein
VCRKEVDFGWWVWWGSGHVKRSRPGGCWSFSAGTRHELDQPIVRVFIRFVADLQHPDFGLHLLRRWMMHIFG